MKKSRLTFTAKDEMARLDKYLPPRKHPAGTAPTMVIDGMNIAYTAKSAYKRLSYKGKSVALLYGIPNILRGLIRDHKPEKVIICWDGLRHPKRLELMPEYKSHRDKKRDPIERANFLKDIERVKRFIYRMGIAQAHREEIEGDDMVYKVTMREVKLRPVIIVSGDKDFIQLINHDITVLNPRERIKISTFAFSCRDEGIELPQYLDYLCMVGDHSDDIKGIPGIGPKRAAMLLKQWYTLDEFFADKKAEFVGMTDKSAALKIIKRNRKMIDLALFNRKYLKKLRIKYYKDNPQPSFDEAKYMETCIKYNMKTLMVEGFKKYFKEL